MRDTDSDTVPDDFPGLYPDGESMSEVSKGTPELSERDGAIHQAGTDTSCEPILREHPGASR